MVETLIGNPVAFGLLVAGIGALIYAATVRKTTPSVSDDFYKDIDWKWQPRSQEEYWLQEIGYMKLISEHEMFIKSTGVYKYGDEADLTVHYHFVSRHFEDGAHFYSSDCTGFRGIKTNECTGENGLNESDIDIIISEFNDYAFRLFYQNFESAVEEEEAAKYA